MQLGVQRGPAGHPAAGGRLLAAGRQPQRQVRAHRGRRDGAARILCDAKGEYLEAARTSRLLGMLMSPLCNCRSGVSGSVRSLDFDGRLSTVESKRAFCCTYVQVSGVHKSMPATVTYKPDTPSSTEQQVPAGVDYIRVSACLLYMASHPSPVVLQVVYSTDCTFTVLSHAQNYTRFLLKLVGPCLLPHCIAKYLRLLVFASGSQWLIKPDMCRLMHCRGGS